MLSAGHEIRRGQLPVAGEALQMINMQAGEYAKCPERPQVVETLLVEISSCGGVNRTPGRAFYPHACRDSYTGRRITHDGDVSKHVA